MNSRSLNSSRYSFTAGRRRLATTLAMVLLGGCQTLPQHAVPESAPGARTVTDSGAPGRGQTSRHSRRATSVAPATLAVARGQVDNMVAPAAHVGAVCPSCNPGPAALPATAYAPEMCWPPAGNYLSPEEFVCNGGDLSPEVIVNRDWTVRGLNAGDTVAHFDTLDGRTKVVASCDVCLYAPRFAAVRKVFAPVISEQHDRPAGIEYPLAASQSSEIGETTTVVQPLQPGRNHRITAPQNFRERTRGIGVENLELPIVAEDQFLPFENLTLIRRGEYDNAEKARLAERLAAAVVWTRNQAPQVIIDNKPAVQIVSSVPLESIYTYEMPPGKPCLQIVKIASRGDAKPGDLVDFTLRFDNLGNQTIGNVTIVDRLHDRLEYIPDSQRSTLPANFFTEEEDGSIRVLRWELAGPLEPRDGGIIRFRARVR